MSNVACCFCGVYNKMCDMSHIDLMLGGKEAVGVKMGVQKVDVPGPIDL